MPLLALPGVSASPSSTSLCGGGGLPTEASASNLSGANFGCSEPSDPVHSGGLTPQLCVAAVFCSLQALACGMATGEINSPWGVMREQLELPLVVRSSSGYPEVSVSNAAWWGAAVGCLSLGAVVGAIYVPYLAGRHGRRLALLFCAALHFAGAMLGLLAGLGSGCEGVSGRSWGSDPLNLGGISTMICLPLPFLPPLAWLIGGRLLSGVACGGSAIALPIYLGELAPAPLRGRLGAAISASAAFGSLLIQASLASLASPAQVSQVAHPILPTHVTPHIRSI